MKVSAATKSSQHLWSPVFKCFTGIFDIQQDQSVNDLKVESNKSLKKPMKFKWDLGTLNLNRTEVLWHQSLAPIYFA